MMLNGAAIGVINVIEMARNKCIILFSHEYLLNENTDDNCYNMV